MRCKGMFHLAICHVLPIRAWIMYWCPPDHQTDSESFCLQLLQQNNCLYYGLGHDPTLFGLQVPVTSIIRTRQHSIMSQNLLL
jgi:hypothetical protein